MSKQTLRIIDANLNRAAEGLRFLEELARFQLNDSSLTERLKTLRHEVVRGDWAFNQQLLEARDAAGDVGVGIATPEPEKQRELPLAVVANARRVQESLRVLEEFAKIPSLASGLEAAKFEHARFELYSIEQALLARLTRLDKRKLISGLYVLIDTTFLKGRSHKEVTAQVIRGGARMIQLRDKLLSRRELLPIARELKQLCAENNVLFIVNDYLDIALASDADGLHLGQDDLPLAEARKLLPVGKILGGSTRTVERALAVEAAGADYMAVGSMYPTWSKETAQVVGVARLREIRQVTALPLVAIGGINKDNIADVLAAGADAIAVISAVMAAPDPEVATRQLVKKIEAKK